MSPAKITVVLGTQWGDEGKGKLVDILAQNIDICARCQVCIAILTFFLYFLLFYLMSLLN